MMPAMRHNVPMTPRAMRPLRWMFGRKKLTLEIYHKDCPWQAGRVAAVFLYAANRQRENG